MNKKATVLVALISMSLIATAGIGAITAASDEPSDEPVGVVSVGTINPDGTLTVLGTFESSEPIDVRVTNDEDGSVNITRNGIRVPEEELCSSPGILYTRPVPVIAISDYEPAVSATIGEINPDGTTTPIKTFRGSGPMSVIVTRNEDGSMNLPETVCITNREQ